MDLDIYAKESLCIAFLVFQVQNFSTAVAESQVYGKLVQQLRGLHAVKGSNSYLGTSQHLHNMYTQGWFLFVHTFVISSLCLER